ncbi:MAG TPA: aminotransferase class V-fold PLP-dependent enzyme [Acidimicrobiales bacterium]|nr:aminotransferase class V-fold PLP-dependent enzyme [Acidimicrobiales bacterium]
MAGRAYLDHASTSPTRPRAVEAMLPWFAAAADPGRIHSEGHAARVAVEVAREQVAALLGARSREVIFTSGATESIVTATWMATERGDHVVVPAVEHSAVREASARHRVTEVGVDRLGRVDPDAVLAAIEAGTALVHLQWGNHEVGTLQPVAEVVAACRQRGVLIHVDAASAAGHVPIDFVGLDADLLSVSAHKLGGPPGVGALLVRRGLRLRPLLVGGDQERARRAGYENVPGVAGFGAAAAVLAEGALDHEAADARRRIARVTDAAASGALGPGVDVLGDPDPGGRLPHLVCLAVAGVEAEPVLLGLDQAGVAVHSGSSCSSESLEPSPVLEAMGVDASRSLRASVGWSTTDDEVEAFCAALPGVVDRLLALGRPAG